MADQDFDILAKLVEKINTDLEKTSSQIGKMQEKIQGFKNTIAQGGLGTFQIQQFNEQIDALTTKIEKAQEKVNSLQTRKTSVVNADNESKRLDALEKQTKQAEALTKAITTLQNKIALYGDAWKDLSKDDPLYQGIARDIKKAEAAIASFQSRLRNQYDPLGHLKTGNEAPTTAPAGRIDAGVNARQNLLLRDAITLREIQSLDAEKQRAAAKLQERVDASTAAFKAGTPIGGNVEKQANDTRILEGVIKSLETKIKELSSTELTAGSNRAKELEDSILLYKTLIDKVNQYKQAQTGTSQIELNGPRTTVHNAPKATTTPTDRELFGYSAEFRSENLRMPQFRVGQGTAGQGQSYQGRFYGDEPPRDSGRADNRTWGQWESQASNKQYKQNMSEAAAAEAERIKGLRDIIRADKRYANAIRIAEQQGFNVDTDLKNIRTRGTGGINQLQFQRDDELGIKRNLDIYSSPSGRASPGISNQFRTFGQGITRDIGELTKWSIALAAIYGPMRKLQELTQEMIANQTKLAEATISVNSAFTGQSKIFEIAADAANKSGEAISGVIDAFTQAYRATGGQGDQVTRLATAQKLLADALVLSKLSSLDQASAIDTLSAAVRQTGGDFNSTTKLLDSWVRVTKVANVDLATLATGFATVGDAANTAGLSADDLNGILATLAESTNQSGQEVANTSRAIISGFQSDQGIRALEDLGIATKDATGNMRSLKDILLEIASLRDKKLIDDTQFSKLTLAIGGGTRRQAAVSTFLENYSRAIAVSNESSRANGDAAAALDKQLQTVQTSLTRLANAFTTLAQTLGTEGGFLSIIQGSVNGMTKLVGLFNSLLGVLGKTTPALVAFVAASAALKYKGIPSVQAGLGGLVESIPQATGPGGQPYLPGMSPRLTSGQKGQNFLTQNVLGNNASSGAVQGLLLAAIPALMNGLNKEDKFGGIKAGADLAGGVIGGIVGSFTGPQGAFIGAAIGTAIAEAFVNSTIARSTDIFGYNTKPGFGEKPRQDLTDEADRNKALQEAQAGLYKSVGGGNEAVGRFITSGSERAAKNLIDGINDAIKTQDKGKLASLLNPNILGNTAALKQLGVTPDQIQTAFTNKQELKATPEYGTYLQASPEAQKAYDVIMAAIKAVDDTKSGLSTPFTSQVKANEVRFGNLVQAEQSQAKSTLANQRISGEVTGAEYARRNEAIGGFDTKALQYYTALGDEFIKVDGNVNSAADAFDAFNTIIVTGAQNSIPELTAIVGQIEDLTNLLNSPELQDKDTLKSLGFDNLAEVSNKLKELKTSGANILSDIYKQTTLNNLKIPSIQGDLSKPLTTGENQLVEQRTQKLQGQFYQGFLQFSDTQYDALKDSFDEFAVTIKDSGDEFFKSVTETDQQFRQSAIQQLQEEGKLRSQKENPFGIQQLDITSQQGAGLQGKIDYFTKYLSQEFPQYKQNPEDIGVIFSDYVTAVLHGDNLAVKLALEKIVDLNQKQLDGMYNIPEGATFWVPLQAAYYKPKDQGGMGGGMPAVDSQAVDGNTSATELNTQALMNATDKWNNADPYLFKRPGNPKEDRYDKMNDTSKVFLGDRYDRMNSGAPSRLAHEDRYDKMSKENQPTSFVDQLKQALSSFWQGLTQHEAPLSGRANVGGGGSVGGRSMTDVAPQSVQARLDMRFENSVQLLVDGRVLASIISPYLSSDLVKFEASQGTITKRYII